MERSQIVKQHDPYKIIIGDRYECLLELSVEEDDDLYDEKGVMLRVIFAVEPEKSFIAKYEFLTASDNKFIALEMVEEEEAVVLDYCQQNCQ
ncbi:DUF6509 family protein [Paenibacillus yanchengensis]|uniref:DUF6509 family protein n=1 Tax=Paenibacillus yanchengensis TaxID=2035833 RepID=A0ABW4YM38_9BACL